MKTSRDGQCQQEGDSGKKGRYDFAEDLRSRINVYGYNQMPLIAYVIKTDFDTHPTESLYEKFDRMQHIWENSTDVSDSQDCDSVCAEARAYQILLEFSENLLANGLGDLFPEDVEAIKRGLVN